MYVQYTCTYSSYIQVLPVLPTVLCSCHDSYYQMMIHCWRGCVDARMGCLLLYCCMGLLVTFVLNSLPPLTVVTCRPAPSGTREESHRYRVHAECTSAGTFVKPIARGGFDTFFSHAHSYATKKESIDDGHQPLFVGQYV